MKIVKYLPVIILLVIATNQQRLAHFHGLTPWKGGGFGMFSSNDSVGARKIRFFAIDGTGRRVEIKPPGAPFDNEIRQVRSFPRKEKLREIMGELLKKRVAFAGWREAEKRIDKLVRRIEQDPNVFEDVHLEYVIYDKAEVDPRLIFDWKEIVAEFWRYDYKQEDASLTRSKVFEMTFKRGAV